MEEKKALYGAGGGRTLTVSLPTDFKSVASAYSATAPLRCAETYFTIIVNFGKAIGHISFLQFPSLYEEYPV